MAEKYSVTPPLFDIIICSCDVGFAKPDPEIYLLGCNPLGIKPENVVFIDDKAENVEAFQRLGGYGIVHVENQTTIQKLSNLLGCKFK